MEIWKDIKGYEGEYQVSNEGRVRSLDRIVTRNTRWGTPASYKFEGHILKGGVFSNGYLFCCLGRKSKNYLIHRLVADAFLEKEDGKDCVDHINGDRSDNRLENLRYCTHKENSNFEIAKERMKNAQNDKTKTVYQYTKDREFVKKYNSLSEAARESNCKLGNLWACCSHYNGVKTCGDYIWSYEPLD